MILSLRSQPIITHVLQCIKLGEDKNNRDFKDRKYQKLLEKNKTMNIPLPVPELKNAFSPADIGRWSSIGTQYLLRYKIRMSICYETIALPNNMELIP
jgi:hypothetical protein